MKSLWQPIIVCGGKYEDNNGVVTSPWFPQPYEDNKICLYNIEAPLGKAIILNFTDFDIENDCDFDSLTIYDGIDTNGTRVGTFCGTRIPPTVVSTLNHIHLIFRSDASNSAQGFRATYSFIDAGMDYNHNFTEIKFTIYLNGVFTILFSITILF